MEAALLGLPCVVLYRLSPVSYFVGRLLVHVKEFQPAEISCWMSRLRQNCFQDEVTAEHIAAGAGTPLSGSCASRRGNGKAEGRMCAPGSTLARRDEWLRRYWLLPAALRQETIYRGKNMKKL
ncbi:MAG: hypothetical protein LKE51_09255 [Selenomonas sp.]|nr:hypothetical protein [Selenomonas sp.]